MIQTIKSTGKRFLALRAQLKKDNDKFKKLTLAQQRVAIAEDVITQIRAKKIIAGSTYFAWGTQASYDYGRGDIDISVDRSAARDADLDLSECVSQVTCRVCGIGSLFVGAVRKNDKLKFTEFGHSRDEETDYLKKWFSADQLNLVEGYYERWGTEEMRERASELDDGLVSPIMEQDDETKRMVMIMQNIISNNGKFNPLKGRHRAVEITRE